MSELFVKACKTGNIKLFRLLKDSKDPELTSDIEKAIMETFENGHIRILKELIELVPDYREIINNSNIKIAIGAGQVNIVKYVINTYSFIDYDITELYMNAVETGNLQIVKFIIEDKKMVSPTSEKIKDLQRACSNGHLKIVEYLLSKGADPNQNESWSVVYATRNGYLSIVKLLIEKGANYHVRNDLAYKTAARLHLKYITEYFDSLEKGDETNGWSHAWFPKT